MKSPTVKNVKEGEQKKEKKSHKHQRQLKARLIVSDQTMPE